MEATVLKLLTASLGDGPARVEAEAALSQLTLQKGFGVVLGAVLANNKFPQPIRQLAGILLRQYIQKHWDSTEEAFQPPEVDEEDKSRLRILLPKALADPDSKLRTAAAMSLAAVGEMDYPERWPALLPSLIQAVRSDNLLLIDGALRCFGVLAEYLTDEQLASAIPVLFPALLNVASSDQFSLSARSQALTIHRTCIAGLLTVTGDSEGGGPRATKLLTASLESFLKLFLGILQSPFAPDQLRSSEGRANAFSLRLQALKTLFKLIEFFPSSLKAGLPAFLKALWPVLGNSTTLFTHTMVRGDQPCIDGFDQHGEAIGVAAFIIEALELLKLLCERKTTRALLKPPLQNLLPLLMGCMQLTTEELKELTSDSAKYIAADDDDFAYSVRVAAYQLLQELLMVFPKTAPKMLVEAMKRGFAEAEKQRKEGEASWWRLREVSVWMVGILGETLETCKVDVGAIVQSVLLVDVDAKNDNAFLRARSLWCLSHLAPLFVEKKQPKVVQAILQGVTAALDMSQSVTVRLAATRALGLMAANIEPPSLLAPIIPASLGRVAELLTHASGDALHTALETLVLIVPINPEVTVKSYDVLIPMLLKAWSIHTEDRLVTESVLDLLESFLKLPSSFGKVQAHTLPVVFSILSEPAKHISGTLEAAIDIMTHLLLAYLKHSKEGDVGALHPLLFQKALPVVISLTLSSEDHSVMQSCCACLSAFVRTAPAVIVKSEYEGRPALQLLLNVIWSLLSPAKEDAAAYGVGSLASTLLFKLGGQLTSDTIAQLLRLVVSRLYSATHPALIESLIMLIARLVHAQGAGRVLDMLQALGTMDVKIKEEKLERAAGELYPKVTYVVRDAKVQILPSVMQKWANAQSDIRSPYACKVTLSALIALVQLNDPRLAEIAVQGYPVVEEKKKGGGVGSASPYALRSSPSADSSLKYTPMPWASKILHILIQEWERLSARAKPRPEEEEEEDDEEEDKDGGMGDEGGVEDSKGWKKLSDFLDADELALMGADLDDVEELDSAEYPERLDDPLDQIQIPTYITEKLQTLRTREAIFTPLIRHLNAGDKEKLHTIVSPASAPAGAAGDPVIAALAGAARGRGRGRGGRGDGAPVAAPAAPVGGAAPPVGRARGRGKK